MIVASHRQSIIRSSLRCWLPVQGRQGQAETRHARCSWYDYPYHNAHATSRSGPTGIQHVAGRSGTSQLRRHWRTKRTDKRTTRGHRTAAKESGVVSEGGHQAAEGGFTLRAPRHRKDIISKSGGKWLGNQFLERCDLPDIARQYVC